MEEVATPYYLFKDAGYEVVIASPNGGPIPIDQNSLGEGFFTDEAKKFMVRTPAIQHDCCHNSGFTHSLTFLSTIQRLLEH